MVFGVSQGYPAIQTTDSDRGPHSRTRTGLGPHSRTRTGLSNPSKNVEKHGFRSFPGIPPFVSYSCQVSLFIKLHGVLSHCMAQVAPQPFAVSKHLVMTHNRGTEASRPSRAGNQRIRNTVCARPSRAGNRRARNAVLVRKVCPKCKVEGMKRKAQTDSWSKGFCRKHALQQGLSPLHKGPKKGLSRNRKAKGKRPKGRLVSKTPFENEAAFWSRLMEEGACLDSEEEGASSDAASGASVEEDLVDQVFEELPKTAPLSIWGRKGKTPRWSSQCICLAV